MSYTRNDVLSEMKQEQEHHEEVAKTSKLLASVLVPLVEAGKAFLADDPNADQIKGKMDTLRIIQADTEEKIAKESKFHDIFQEAFQMLADSMSADIAEEEIHLQAEAAALSDAEDRLVGEHMADLEGDTGAGDGNFANEFPDLPSS